MTKIASLNASTPNLSFPLIVLAKSLSLELTAISNAPAPGKTEPSSRANLTALSPSLIASLICAIAWSF